MKKIDFDLKNNPFINFKTARYSMSARINVENLWKYAKENNYSFFILSLGCLINGVNSVPNLKKRILDGEAIEYDYLDGVTPIMTKDSEIYKEMRVEPPKNILKWHDHVQELESDILTGKKERFNLEMTQRDLTNIANFSCIPWVDFDTITSCEVNGHEIQPLISWGKVNKNYEMSVAITVNHIFVHGRDLAYFYENTQKEFDLDIFNDF